MASLNIVINIMVLKGGFMFMLRLNDSEIRPENIIIFS